MMNSGQFHVVLNQCMRLKLMVKYVCAFDLSVFGKNRLGVGCGREQKQARDRVQTSDPSSCNRKLYHGATRASKVR
jgi:hypothetical protein